MTRNAQDIIDDMRGIVKPIIAKMLFEANFEGCGKEDKAEFETEFEMILTLAEMALGQEPCGDCISRQAVLDIVNNPLNIRLDEIIKKLPPVTPAEKTGRWIEKADEYYRAINEKGGGVINTTPYFVDDVACSECLTMFSTIDNETERFEFCPNCGAKMQEGD